MNKAIIMEVTSRHWIVMTPCGQFKKVAIRSNDHQVGDEIQLQRASFMQRRSLLSAAIACLLLVFIVVSLVPGIFSQNQVVAAYVTIDVNPSIELGLDHKGRIVEATGINEEGEQLLASVGDLKGLYASDAAKKIFQSTMITDLLQPYFERGGGNIVISSTVVTDDLEQFNESEITNHMVTEIKSLFSSEEDAMNGKLAVTNLYTPRELREEAKKHGVSAGKVAIKLLSVELGKQLEWSDLQNTAIDQIAAELGGWEQLIAIEQDVTKDKFRELYHLQMQTVNVEPDVKTSTEEKNSETEETESEPNTSNEWPNSILPFAGKPNKGSFQNDDGITLASEKTNDDRGNRGFHDSHVDFLGDRNENANHRGRSEEVRDRSHNGWGLGWNASERDRSNNGRGSEQKEDAKQERDDREKRKDNAERDRKAERNDKVKQRSNRSENAEHRGRSEEVRDRSNNGRGGSEQKEDAKHDRKDREKRKDNAEGDRKAERNGNVEQRSDRSENAEHRGRSEEVRDRSYNGRGSESSEENRHREKSSNGAEREHKERGNHGSRGEGRGR